MEASASVSVPEAIGHMAASDEPLVNATLTELSGLSRAELQLLTETWPAITVERRRQIVRRLVEMAEDNIELSFDVILRSCLRDPDEDVRTTAIEGLWENEEPSLIKPLINLLEKDASEKVRAAAATALGKFAVLAEQNKIRPDYKAMIGQALLAAVDDKQSTVEVRRRALESAAALNLPEVKEAIAEAYQSLDPRLKASSIFAMGRSLDPAWLPQLLKELSSPDAELRYEACGACGELEEAAAVPGLAELTGDTDIDVQMAAIVALGKIGTPQAKSCLKNCLASKNENVRQAAEHALGYVAAKEDPLSLRLYEKE